MKTFFRLAFLLLIASLASAQTANKIGTASISGKVLMDGKAAADALVILRRDEQVSRAQVTAPPRTTTDASGQYRFTGLAAGKYIVSVAAPGYINTKRESDWEQSSRHTLADGDTLDTVDFTLVKAGVITGRITDEQGRPVIEEQPVLYRLESGGKKVFAVCNTVTDDRGVYRCFNVPPGQYIFGAGKDEQKNDTGGFNAGVRVPYVRRWYPNVSDEDKAKVIDVVSGSEVTEIDLKLVRRKKGVTVTGQVLTADTKQPVTRGAAVGFAKVNAEGKTLSIQISDDSIVNPDGEFRIQNLLPGKYKLTPMLGEGGEYYGESQIVEVDTTDVTGLELKVERGATITGVAVLEDHSNADVTRNLARLQVMVFPPAEANWQGAPATSLIGAEGRFQLKGLRAGKAKIVLARPEPDLRGFSITHIERDGAPVPDGIEVKAGEAVTGVRVTIGYGSGVIRGVLQLANGSLPEDVGVRVRAARNGRVVGAAQPDTNHRFALEGLMPGTYELTLETYTTRFPFDKPAFQLSSLKQTVEVTNGQEATVTISVDLSGKGGRQ